MAAMVGTKPYKRENTGWSRWVRKYSSSPGCQTESSRDTTDDINQQTRWVILHRAYHVYMYYHIVLKIRLLPFWPTSSCTLDGGDSLAVGLASTAKSTMWAYYLFLLLRMLELKIRVETVRWAWWALYRWRRDGKQHHPREGAYIWDELRILKSKPSISTAEKGVGVAVAGPGFLEGGLLLYGCAQSVCKTLKPCPFLGEHRPFRSFWAKLPISFRTISSPNTC